MVRVRFAPSPTGSLHVGGLRTALYNYLLARREGGRFLLRIEDTDRARYVEGAVENILENLRWAGIPPDEGAGVGGERGPYVQSQRLPLYREHSERLVAAGRAYRCFCTPERLAGMRAEQQARGQATLYDRRCRSLSAEEANRRAAAGEPHVVRMMIPEGETLVVDDLVRGRVAFDSDRLDDQVLLKSDGFPTYHLAAVVDDHRMEISHVIRGEEWLSSTPKHLLLYRYFGWEPPRFAHLPLIVNRQGKKLSKRDGDVSVDAYREGGYLPQALLNFLALLGWSPGDEREFFTLQDLEREFTLERVRRSASVFDFDKLRYLNFLHLRRASAEELAAHLPPYFRRAGLEPPPLDYLSRVRELMRERAFLLNDLVEGVAYFYRDPETYEAGTVKKRWRERSPALVRGWLERLEDLPEWKRDALEASLRGFAEEQGVGAGQVIHPVRLAVSGVGHGPGLFEMLEVLGRERCLRRLRAALEKLR